MIKRVILSISIVLLISGCKTSEVEDRDTNSTLVEKPSTKTPKVVLPDRPDERREDQPKSAYYYIPTGDSLTQEMAYRFLNMATLGATPELANELRQKGVVNWVNEQLNIPYDPKKDSTLRQALRWGELLHPDSTLRGRTIDEIIDSSGIKRANHRWSVFVNSAVIGGMLDSKSHLRQKVAYALSQTIIASESVDAFFFYRMEALAYYYDFLLKHSFGNYGDLLYDISLTPAMATFLTYNGNRKAYTNDGGSTIKPDENYAREIMQLFTIGLYDLNIDGMQKGVGSRFKQSYTQQDVNEMARVFTGLTLKDVSRYGRSIRFSGDSIHPLECVEDYHDSEEKKILGKTLPANQNCYEDVRGAINILVSHDNIAPFISKKLIMRLTKSNPKGEYIERVAKVFNDNGDGVKGDLKAVVRAILLDKDIWDDIKNGYGSKVKEPFLAYIGAIRALGYKPTPNIFYSKTGTDRTTDEVQNIYNKFFLESRGYYDSFAQSPLHSPTVFNFYSDDFVPNSNEFRMYNFVAPELEIQTTKYLILLSEKISYMLNYRDDKHILQTYRKKHKTLNDYYKERFRERFRIDSTPIYNRIISAFNGDINSIPTYRDSKAKEAYKKLVEISVDSISWQLLGKKLPKEQVEFYVKTFSDPNYIRFTDSTRFYYLYVRVIIPITKQIILSDEYMVQ